MQINGTLHGNARTYLTHLFGQGLDDQRYVVERYLSDYEGQIRPWRPGKGSKGGRKQARKVMSLRAVQRLRPERHEVIVCTGVNLTDSGMQMWGSYAAGIFVERMAAATVERLHARMGTAARTPISANPLRHHVGGGALQETPARYPEYAQD